MYVDTDLNQKDKLQKIRQFWLRDPNEPDRTNAGVGNMDGSQELNDTTLFGEHIYLYDILINQYIHDKQLDLSVAETIVAMVEVGVFKMGHIRQLEQLCNL
ncbi:MAG: hypothetical protein GQ532_20340 [Methylomarinum sp.]|nr:hypothetical protein [Methylomarinum sp.]